MNKNEKARKKLLRKAGDNKFVKPAPGHLASVARKPVLDKSMPHWTMLAQTKFWNARNHAEALEVIASVSRK